MTISELKNKVAKSEHFEWFENRMIELSYDHANFQTTIKGMTAIFKFVVGQLEGFKSLGQDLPNEFKRIVDAFDSVRNYIVSLVNANNPSDYDWNNYVKNPLEGKKPLKLLYDSPITDFLIRVFNEYPKFYPGAYHFITQDSLGNTGDKNYMTGYIMAYEFLSSEYSEIFKRKESEKRSIAKIRSDFEKYVSEADLNLTAYLNNANAKVIEASTNIDELLKAKKENFDQWFTGSNADFNSFFSSSKEKISGLEELYTQKLKLEAPAKYWNDRATKLRKEGYKWLCGLVGCIVVGVAIMVWVLNQIADGTLTQLFANTATAIKWSIGLITLISFIAYAIRVISKLTFSSFHLVRDAEEREQLTYVYLALQKEKGVDVTERHLIMQSLFSRADSGLLKDEASPTMPGNIIDKFISK